MQPTPLRPRERDELVDTPAEIVARLNNEVNAALVDATFANLGVEGFATSLPELAAFIGDYTQSWGKVIRAAGIKAE